MDEKKKAVQNYISEHLAEEITIEELARVASFLRGMRERCSFHFLG